MRINSFISKLHCFWILAFLVVFTCELKSQQLLVNTGDGILATIDVNGCEDQSVANIGNYTDIAAHPDGNIYAINTQGELFRIDLINSNVTAVVSFVGDFFYALTSDAEGTLYAATANGTLTSYNPAIGQVLTYPNIGSGAGGDLTFYKGQLYLATNVNTILSVHPNNPSLNEVVIDFTDTNVEIFGVVSTLVGCEIRSFAISGDNNARIFEIGWDDKSFTEICTADTRIFGGSSEFEFKSSQDGFAIASFEKRNALCEDADLTVTLNGVGYGSAIEYSLDGINYQESNVFEDLDFGIQLVYMRDERGCEGLDSIELLPGSLEIELGSLEAARCGIDNGRVELVISSNADQLKFTLNDEAVDIVSNLSALSEGSYILNASDSDGCMAELEFDIEALPAIKFETVEIEDANCGSFNGKITALPNDVANYLLDGQSSASGIFENLEPKTYELRLIDENNCFIDTTVMIRDVETCDIFIPNVFSPNEDGINDRFLIYSEFPREISFMRIFDRWGSKVYEAVSFVSSDENMAWDGTINGNKAVEGAYTFYFELNGGLKKIPFSGIINLQR